MKSILFFVASSVGAIQLGQAMEGVKTDPTDPTDPKLGTEKETETAAKTELNTVPDHLKLTKRPDDIQRDRRIQREVVNPNPIQPGAETTIKLLRNGKLTEYYVTDKEWVYQWILGNQVTREKKFFTGDYAINYSQAFANIVASAIANNELQVLAHGAVDTTAYFKDPNNNWVYKKLQANQLLPLLQRVAKSLSWEI